MTYEDLRYHGMKEYALNIEYTALEYVIAYFSCYLAQLTMEPRPVDRNDQQPNKDWPFFLSLHRLV